MDCLGVLGEHQSNTDGSGQQTGVVVRHPTVAVSDKISVARVGASDDL